MKPEVAVAVRFVQQWPLQSVHVAQLEAKVLGVHRPSDALGWVLDSVDVRWGRDDNLLKVITPFRIWITSTKSDGVVAKVMEIAIILRIDYAQAQAVDASDDDTSHFAGIQAVMHSWPYFRAEVQALTTKLELPPLTLPPIVAGQIPSFVSADKLPVVPLQVQVLDQGIAERAAAQGSLGAPIPKKKSSRKGQRTLSKRAT